MKVVNLILISSFLISTPCLLHAREREGKNSEIRETLSSKTDKQTENKGNDLYIPLMIIAILTIINTAGLILVLYSKRKDNKDNIDEIKQALDKLKEEIDKIPKNNSSFNEGEIEKIANKVVQKLKSGIPENKPSEQVEQKFKEILNKIFNEISKKNNLSLNEKEIANKVADSINQQIKGIVNEAIQKLKSEIPENKTKEILNKIDEISRKNNPSLNENEIEEIADKVIQKLKSGMPGNKPSEQVGQTLQAILSKIDEISRKNNPSLNEEEIANKVVEKLKDEIGNIRQLTEKQTSGVENEISGENNPSINVASSIDEQIKKIVNEAVEKLKGEIDNIKQSNEKQISSVKEELKKDIGKVVENLKSEINTTRQNFEERIGEVENKINSVKEELKNNIKSENLEIKKKLKSIKNHILKEEIERKKNEIKKLLEKIKDREIFENCNIDKIYSLYWGKFNWLNEKLDIVETYSESLFLRIPLRVLLPYEQAEISDYYLIIPTRNIKNENRNAIKKVYKLSFETAEMGNYKVKDFSVLKETDKGFEVFIQGELVLK